jgi:hypothetical protein
MMKELRNDDFLATYFNYGIVVRGRVKDLGNFKELVSKSLYATGVQAIFQITDPRKLRVIPEGEGMKVRDDGKKD